MTVATMVTLVRIIAIPFLVLVFYWPSEQARFWAAGLFGLASLTDWLDGYLARRMKQVSSMGKFLDPVADKLMVATALVLLLQQHPTALFAVAVAIVIGREITVSALRERMAELGIGETVAVSWLGKWKTTFQMLSIFFLLWNREEPIGGLSMYDAGLFMFYLAVLLTIVSMVHYLVRALPRL
ncbi:MAG: CDP-diacylglycerol--glycerol-3-phosphate 3-phosphatidyltransferase [Gammaproteobacteria bacterium]|nr:MAG: CDP-diacylglycerol--glycerol-3-phosphate 3-phosphatidyltransferase [Gammaproteobacteria bacterium]